MEENKTQKDKYRSHLDTLAIHIIIIVAFFGLGWLFSPQIKWVIWQGIKFFNF